ncbi:hypothetical protein DPMN_053256, partial [Dreissena polymorpha]
IRKTSYPRRLTAETANEAVKKTSGSQAEPPAEGVRRRGYSVRVWWSFYSVRYSVRVWWSFGTRDGLVVVLSNRREFSVH